MYGAGFEAFDFGFSSSFSSVLLVRDVAGVYRPAQAAEVLQAAQELLLSQVRHLEVLSSPQLVRDFLRVCVIAPAGAAGRADFVRVAGPLHDHRLVEILHLDAVFQSAAASASIRDVLRAGHRQLVWAGTRSPRAAGGGAMTTRRAAPRRSPRPTPRRRASWRRDTRRR